MKAYVSMYFLHLMLTFFPQNDVMVNGPLLSAYNTQSTTNINVSENGHKTVKCLTKKPCNVPQNIECREGKDPGQFLDSKHDLTS